MSSQLRWIFALFQVVLHSFVTTVTVPEHTVVVPKPVCSYQNYITFQRHLQGFDPFHFWPAFFRFQRIFYDIPRFERLKPRASAGAAALPSTLLRSSMTARLPTCSCWLTEISPDVILSHGVGNAVISFDMEQFYSFQATPITIYISIRKPRELPEL